MKLNAARMKLWMLRGTLPLSCIGLFHTGSFMVGTALWLLIGFMISEKEVPPYSRKITAKLEGARAVAAWSSGAFMYQILLCAGKWLNIFQSGAGIVFRIACGISSCLSLIFFLKNQFSFQKSLILTGLQIGTVIVFMLLCGR